MGAGWPGPIWPQGLLLAARGPGPMCAQHGAQWRHVELCQPLQHPDLAKPAWLGQGHPQRRQGPGAGQPPGFVPMAARPWPSVAWHCHANGGTAPCPPALPPQSWRGHGHVSSSIATLVVASPWPHVPQHHHAHGGTAMAICPPGITTLMVAPRWPRVPQHHHAHGGTAMTICPLASLPSWWQLHGHMSTRITTHMVAGLWSHMCPLASPHSWWHLHGHMSHSTTVPMVTRPWSHVPWSHHPHSGTSMATCPPASPQTRWHGHGCMFPATITPTIPWPWPHVPWHCHAAHG